MKKFTYHAGIVFMAMATTICALPKNSEPVFTSQAVATASEITLAKSPDDSLTIPNEVEPNPDPDPSTNPPEDDETPPTVELPPFFIKAINPGYTIDKVKESGEFIELSNTTGSPIDLTGVTLTYTNSKGNVTELFTFPENSVMSGANLVLRYTKSPEQNQADAVYKTSLAMSAGPLQLLRDGELIDSVCWNGDEDCNAAFKSSTPTTLVRNLTTLDFEHLPMSEYFPQFTAENPSLILPELDESAPTKTPTSEKDDKTTSNANSKDKTKVTAPPHCQKLAFSEILTYYEDSAEEQFIELYNPTENDVVLDGCAIKYKNKRRELSGKVLAYNYYAFYPEDFTLTKNPV